MNMKGNATLKSLVERGCRDLTGMLDLDSNSFKAVGGGGSSRVHGANLQGGGAIALKFITEPSPDSLDDLQKIFRRTVREIYMWSKCRHPGVLELLGMVRLGRQLAMVSPLMSNGALPNFLRTHPQCNRVLLCAQLAEAVEFSHLRGVIHGDIKPLNVLVSDDGTPLLGDFGSARFNGETSLPLTPTNSVTATYRYAAPEILGGDSVQTTESDIYAFGMTVLEIVTGRVPFAEIKATPRVIVAVLEHKQTPKRPDLSHLFESEDLKDKFWALLQSSWSYDPKQRPSATQLKDALRGFCL